MHIETNSNIPPSLQQNAKKNVYRRFFKRPLDIVLSLTGIILLSPVIMIVAILVRLKLGSPVIFKQLRPGLNEKIFTMCKFRTMTDERDKQGELLPDSVRLTSFGKFLRVTSLDELPELFNILKGDMSLVGPRPQLIRDLVFMTNNQRERHNVLPGLTGWAQVNGRNCVTWEKKLAYDIEYKNNVSFIGDLKIIIKTVFKVINRDGINTEGFDTAEDLGEYLLREKKITKDEYLSKQKSAKYIIQKHSN